MVTHTQAHTNSCPYTHTHTRTHTQKHRNTRAHTHTHIHTHKRMVIHTHTHTHTKTHNSSHTQIHAHTHKYTRHTHTVFHGQEKNHHQGGTPSVILPHISLTGFPLVHFFFKLHPREKKRKRKREEKKAPRYTKLQLV